MIHGLKTWNFQTWYLFIFCHLSIAEKNLDIKMKENADLSTKKRKRVSQGEESNIPETEFTISDVSSSYSY